MKYNKEKILMIVGIITLLVFVGGATFAYFVAQGGNAEQTGVNVLTHTTDSLVFEVGESISLTADQTTFAPGAGNRSDNTFARATLKANSSTNSATDHYYVYLSIDTNEFKYTTDTKTAELILTVNYKDTNGNVTPVTSINGLNYVTVGEVSGFDITEEKNLITIANNHEITSTGTEVDEWDITLTLVNLDSNQTANAGKTFNATLIIQKEMVASQYIASLFTTQGANHLYHHDGSFVIDVDIFDSYFNDLKLFSAGDIYDANDGSYRYAGGDFVIAPAYQETYKHIIGSNKGSSIKAIIRFVCDGKELYVGATCDYGKEYYYFLGYDTNETKTQYASYQEAINQAVTDGYLEETPVKNYVCFGDDCTNSDNLYRILGVFNTKIKLVKADYAGPNLLGQDGDAAVISETPLYYSGYKTQKVLGRYYWNKVNKDKTYVNSKSDNNAWSNSELNKTNLNANFINNIGSKWSNKISESTWYVTDDSSHNLAKLVYNSEKKGEMYKAKIGLIYISDYLYGAESEIWKKSTYSPTNGGFMLYKYTNWLYLGKDEWSISQRLNFQETETVRFNGGTGGNDDPTSNALFVRPTFYLKSSVTFAGGTGTSTDPYRIA